ncbi:MAG: DUF5658 family protein [Planctomycetota bacterium]
MTGYALPLSKRSTRITLVLAIVGVLHVFDLAFTQNQLSCDGFVEVNCLAANFIETPVGLMLYKAGMFGLGALVLCLVRRHWQTEVGVWFLLAISVGLMAWWGLYFYMLDPGNYGLGPGTSEIAVYWPTGG